MGLMERLSAKITRVLGSNGFFWTVLAFFLFQALWLVFSAAYPMAFDEAYHLILIQVFAEQWSPFITQHPENADVLGVVTRDISYLYHYLMSFPYRVIATVTESQIVQVLLLRLINVGLFVSGLILMRRLLDRLKISRALSHSSLLLFSLVPIVPLLAAHINYDNLLMLMVPILLILTIDIFKALGLREIPLAKLLGFLALSGFLSVTKLAVMPVVAIAVLAVAVYACWSLRHAKLKSLCAQIASVWRALPFSWKLVWPALVLLAMVLFIESYGVNLWRYQSIQPDCEEVLSLEQCLEFGPYERTYNYRQNPVPDFEPSLDDHITRWSEGMWYRTFFMVNGDLTVDRYHSYPPLPLPAFTATAIFLAGLAAAIYTHVFRRPEYILFGLVSGFYVFMVWAINYTGSYGDTGRVAATNGRYLLLVALPLIAICGAGLSRALKGKEKTKVTLVLLAVILMLNGGGVISFWARSSSTWWLPHPVVWEVNHAVSEAVDPLIIGKDYLEPL